MSDFFQEPPRLTNTFESNRWLRTYLRHKMPKEIYAHIEADLHRLGALCAAEYNELGRAAEGEKPTHVPFDAWGRRIDEIKTSTAWKRLHEISALEGLIAIGYKRAQGEYSRLYQFAKLYLFHPSSAFYTCPLAMADGAARVLEMHGKTDLHREAFSHLTSDSPQEFWTSGQWMTEKTGGSDVSGTSTVARMERGEARLYGTKWFSSATTSEMALALARVEGSPEGSRGLTLFMVPLRNADGALNNIKVLRLKDKLGTRALPTAELELTGARAYQVGERDQGVKTVATMLNITRLYNSVCSIGQMTRALEQMQSYAKERTVFGAKLASQVLHVGTFAQEELKNLAGFLLTFEVAHLVGKEETGKASAGDSALVRLLTPITKLSTARSSVQVASEVIEGFGGAGYVEDTGVAVHLRDAQVFSIWEGATNVLSLDLLRVLANPKVIPALAESVQKKLGVALASEQVKPLAERFMQHTLAPFENELLAFEKAEDEVKIASSRELAFFLARMYAYVLLLEWAAKESPENRQTLVGWLVLFAQDYLGTWRLKTRQTIDGLRRLSDGSLTP